MGGGAAGGSAAGGGTRASGLSDPIRPDSLDDIRVEVRVSMRWMVTQYVPDSFHASIT